jgi:broad specificity phosphatase PhoE
MRTLSLLLALLAGGAPLHGQDAAAAVPPTVVILVRHAETEPDGTADPALSAAGAARAERLAEMHSGARLDGVHSTPLRRTRETAAAVAGANGVPLREYDPAGLVGLAERLTREGGTHLVVGHSNTTPALVRALGGDPGAPIPESEYGRLYVVFPAAGGAPARTLRLDLPPG